MDKEFITIGEASRLLRQADGVVMRLIKEALIAGVEKEEIMKAEMRDGRMMYLISKTFLFKEAEKEREAPKEEQPAPLLEKEFVPLNEESMGERMIQTLQKVIDTKDQQIDDLSGKIDQLIERDHETNVLLKGLQDRLFLLEQGDSRPDEEREEVASSATRRGGGKKK